LRGCIRAQASSFKLNGEITERCKAQATSLKPQAASFELQATSGKQPDSGSLIKFYLFRREVLD
jgi:hypothetical protein